MEKTKPFCCKLNSNLQEIYYEQIMGKRGYALGYYATYYYLLKEYKKAGELCSNCQEITQKLWDIYWETKNKSK